MYILYESYTDETRNMKDLNFNTKIIGLYETKEQAKDKLKEYLDYLVKDFETEYNWFVKKYNKKIIKDDERYKNVIDIYEVFNDYIDNIAEMYYLILEKVESDLNENDN